MPPERGGGGGEKKGVDTDEPADHGLGLCRGGFGSKLHVMTDGNGHVLQIVLTRGNRNEVPVLGPLLAATVSRHRRRPGKLAADKGYSADRIRRNLLALGIKPVIPMRHNEHVRDRREQFGTFDKQARTAGGTWSSARSASSRSSGGSPRDMRSWPRRTWPCSPLPTSCFT
jgi:IS5 family transposase